MENIIAEPKVKISKAKEKDVKIVEQTVTESQYENFGRSSRAKFLTAKDGRGKILVGDDYQADLPNLAVKDEGTYVPYSVLTIWEDNVKNNLLSRRLN
jgi:hypothetical protein